MKKTQKSFRKKALLSSLSMLMVATVAVGSATFAWFTSNKSVTASGMSVKAAAAKGLQITGRNADDAWGPSYTFKTAELTLAPVSIDYSKTTGETTVIDTKLGTPYAPKNVKETGAWSTNTAANFDEFAAASYPKAAISDDATTKDAVASNTNFAAYQVSVRSTGDDITNAKLKVTFADKQNPTVANASKFMRIAVIEQTKRGTGSYTTGKLIGVYGDEVKDNVNKTIEPNAIAAITPSVSIENQVLLKSEAEIDLSNTTIGKTGKHYTVLVWFEGQDPECVDDYQAAEGSISINFSYE